MDLNRLTRDADDLIRKVVSRYNQLYVPAGNISQVELDLMLDDLRKLYDTFKNIGQVSLTLQNSLVKPEVRVNIAVPVNSQPVSSASPVFSEKQVHPVDIAAEPPQSDPDPEPINEVKPVITSEPEPEMDLIKANEVESVPEPETEAEMTLIKEKEVESVPEPEPEADPVGENQVLATTEISDMGKPVLNNFEKNNPVYSDPTPATLADRFNSGNKSLSETMVSSQPLPGIGSRLQFQPISDLNTGIGINDKFSFINELFSNNPVQYDEAINRINKAVNLDEANWILQKYHSSEWEQKHESLNRLKDFVKRRFI